MVALMMRVASVVLMYVLFLQLSQAASIPINKSVPTSSPSENATSSLLSKLIKLKSSTPDIPSEHDVEKRNAVRDRSKRWPNATVPYELDDDFNETQRQSVRTAMEQFHNETCIRFIERSNQIDYLIIELGDIDSSEVGRQGGVQMMTLTPAGTLAPRVVVHELMHTLGFYHEQSRSDRDRYVTIKWRNIQRDRKGDFKKYNQSQIDHLNSTYDFFSIMHYRARAFGIEGKKTIDATPTVPRMGRVEKLSYKDVLELRRYYECECVDRKDECGHWSSTGQCTRRANYMRRHCPLSCEKCDT